MYNKLAFMVLSFGFICSLSNSCMDQANELNQPLTSIDTLLNGEDPRLPLDEVTKFFDMTPQLLLTKEEIAHRKAFGAARSEIQQLQNQDTPNLEKIKELETIVCSSIIGANACHKTVRASEETDEFIESFINFLENS